MTTQDTKVSRLFAAHTPQKDYLSRMCRHSFCATVSVAELVADPENAVTVFSHTHDEYEFLLPYAPIPLIKQENAVYFGEVGYGYPVDSGRAHGTAIEYSNIANDNIVVDCAFMRRLLDEKGLSDSAFNSRFEVSFALRDYLRLFKQEFEKGSAADKADLECLARLIVSELIELGCRPKSDRRKPAQEYQKGVYAAVEYINRHFAESICIDDLAAMSGFTKNYFITSFRRMMGEAPYAHISKLRLSKSKTLLEATDISIRDVSVQCGYNRPNAFTALFTKTVGLTPSEYREKYRRDV